MPDELKPCPFCGGMAVFKTKSNNPTHYSVGFTFKIECEDCGIGLNKTYNIDFNLTKKGEINILNEGRTKAIEEWNRRVKSE